jgi:hypothetical protein
MDYIRLENQDEAVRRFVLSLKLDNGGTLLELNGQAVACIVPAAARNGSEDGDWTDARNDRRCELIERKYAGALTAAEAVELHALQEEMYRHVDRVAPLPVEDARRLHQELLRKAKDSATP